DAEKTKVTKGDLEQAGNLSLTSSSLSVSSGFGNQFLNLSSDTSLIVTPTTTPPPPHSISTITLVLHQKTTPIPTPPITTVAPVAITVPDPLPTIAQRVSILEKYVQELKQVDHSIEIPTLIRSHVPSAVNEYLGSSLGDLLQKLLQKHTEELKRELKQQESHKSSSEIIKIKQEHASKKNLPKHSSTPFDKTAENEYKQKDILFKMMLAFKSFKKHPAHKELYDALIKSLLVDEDDIDQAAAAMGESALLKRKHDDKDEDPSARLNQGKRKRSSGKDSEPLNKPLPLKGNPGHLTVAAEYFFNNDMEYLKSTDSERKYTTSITKMKAAMYELLGTKDMIPKLWSVTKVGYDKNVTFGIKHWGPKHQQFYIAQLNRFSKHDVYSPMKILSVVSVKVNKLHGYGYLEEIIVRRADRQKYKFKEGDFVNLHMNDIEDMLLLVVQHKLFHLDGEVIVDLVVALHMFTRNLIIKKRVKDVQIGVESYQKKLNITKPQKRKWSATYQKQSGIMVNLIDKHMLERRILRNLKRLVGARELEMDYRLMQRTV
ncbi:hypothetical protein Tco_0950417, partial [Tanacetum coccineum]